MFIAATVANPIDPTPQIDAGYVFLSIAVLCVNLLTCLHQTAAPAISSTFTRSRATNATILTPPSRPFSTTRSSPQTRAGALVAPRSASPATVVPNLSSIPVMASTTVPARSSCTDRTPAPTDPRSRTAWIKMCRDVTRRPSGPSSSSARL